MDRVASVTSIARGWSSGSGSDVMLAVAFPHRPGRVLLIRSHREVPVGTCAHQVFRRSGSRCQPAHHTCKPPFLRELCMRVTVPKNSPKPVQPSCIMLPVHAAASFVRRPHWNHGLGDHIFRDFFFEIELLIFMVIGLVLQLTEALSHTGRHLADTAAMIE